MATSDMASTATFAPLQAQSDAPSIQLSQQQITGDNSSSGNSRRGIRNVHSHEGQRAGRGRGRGQRGGRGDGRGNQKDHRQSNGLNRPPPHVPPLPDLGDGGTSGGRPTGDAKTKKGEVGEEAHVGQEEDTEAEVCFICASPVIHHSIAPCNHRTCHICALRLRALYKTRACAHCRVGYPQDTSSY